MFEQGFYVNTKWRCHKHKNDLNAEKNDLNAEKNDLNAEKNDLSGQFSFVDIRQ